MSRSPLRPTTAPHTNKPPGACPYCGSHAVTRKGVRKKKLEIVQLWRCASCKRLFTPGPTALRNKTYPIRLVLQALTLYNLGYSLGDTAKRLKSKAGRAVSPTTIATWIGAHKEHTTFRRLRAEAKTIYPPTQRSARSSCITARSTPTRIIDRSSRCCAAIRNINASKRSRLFSKTFPLPVPMNYSGVRTIRRPALRKHSPRLPTPIASLSIAKRTRRPRPRR
jgi:transposase-like protein